MKKFSVLAIALSAAIASASLSGCQGWFESKTGDDTANDGADSRPVIKINTQDDGDDTGKNSSAIKSNTGSALTNNETDGTNGENDNQDGNTGGYSKYIRREDIHIDTTYKCDEGGMNAIRAIGTAKEVTNAEILKSGEAEAGNGLKGENAATLAASGGSLKMLNCVIESNGRRADAVAVYDEGSSASVEDSYFKIKASRSSGLFAEEGASANADNITIEALGYASPAVKSGGGDIWIKGGRYSASGEASPAIHAAGAVTASGAKIESEVSESAKVEGGGSVSFSDCEISANTSGRNGMGTRQAVILTEPEGGGEGKPALSISGGKLSNGKGDMFLVSGAESTISLYDTELLNRDNSSAFLRIEDFGGADLGARMQKINGGIAIDSGSWLNMRLTAASTFDGYIEGSGDTYVEIGDGSRWNLTEDSSITSLNCGTGSINLNGHRLIVNGSAYQEGAVYEGGPVDPEHKIVSLPDDNEEGQEYSETDKYETLWDEDENDEGDSNEEESKPDDEDPERSSDREQDNEDRDTGINSNTGSNQSGNNSSENDRGNSKSGNENTGSESTGTGNAGTGNTGNDQNTSNNGQVGNTGSQQGTGGSNNEGSNESTSQGGYDSQTAWQAGGGQPETPAYISDEDSGWATGESAAVPYSKGSAAPYGEPGLVPETEAVGPGVGMTGPGTQISMP